MERLWLANIAPGTSDDKLKELFRKYAPELECVEIQHEEGTGECDPRRSSRFSTRASIRSASSRCG
jgi:hypothetical protein